MHGVIFFAILFVAKVVDNALSTAKTILIQRSRWIIAGVIVMLLRNEFHIIKKM